MQTEKSRVSTPCPTPVGIFKEAFVGGGGGKDPLGTICEKCRGSGRGRDDTGFGRRRWQSFVNPLPSPDLARILGAGLRVFKLQKPLWLPLPHLPLQDGKPLLGVMNVTLCPRGS